VYLVTINKMYAYSNKVVKSPLVLWKKCKFCIGKLILVQAVIIRRHVVEGIARHHTRTTATVERNFHY